MFGNRNGQPLRESKLLRVVDASHRKAIEALERELFPSVPKLPDGPKPADLATRDFRVA